MSVVQRRATFETAGLEQVSRGDIVIRRPSELDISGLAALFSEMQSHYDRPVSDEAATMAAKLAARPPVGTFDPRVLIALIGSIIVGSIVMNVTFPACE